MLFEQKPHQAALESLVTVKPNMKGIVSYLYNILLHLKNPPLKSIKDNWLKELGIEITNEEWKTCIKNIHRG